MSSTAVIGLANTHEQAHFVVDRLQAAGFSEANLSIPASETIAVDQPVWIRSSDILVTVPVDDIRGRRRVKEIFARTGVREVESLGNKAA